MVFMRKLVTGVSALVLAGALVFSPSGASDAVAQVCYDCGPYDGKICFETEMCTGWWIWENCSKVYKYYARQYDGIEFPYDDEPVSQPGY